MAAHTVSMVVALLIACALTFLPGAAVWTVLPVTWSAAERALVVMCCSHATSFLIGFTALAVFRMEPTAATSLVMTVGVFSLCIAVVGSRHRGGPVLTDDLLGTLAWIVTASTIAVLATSAVRTITVSHWIFDWWEHWERTKFYLDGLPRGWRAGPYILPARPPLQNVLTALAIAPSPSFAGFQAATAVYALPTVAAVVLVCERMRRVLGTEGGPEDAGHGGSRRRLTTPAWRALTLTAVSPIFLVNIVFPWTKLLSAAYVVGGIVLYSTAMRERDRLRFVLAVVFLATAITVHYSAAPFAIVVGLDAVVRFLARPTLRRTVLTRRTLFGSALAMSVLVLWVAWSAQRFGLRVTLTSNTSANTGSGPLSIIGRMVNNFAISVAPTSAFSYRSPNPVDRWFTTTQTSIIGGLGLTSVIGCAHLARRHGRAIWSLLRPLAVPISAALLLAGASAPRYKTGLAHVLYQPVWLFVFGAVAATRFRGRMLIVAGSIDAVFVIARLHEASLPRTVWAYEGERVRHTLVSPIAQQLPSAVSLVLITVVGVVLVALLLIASEGIQPSNAEARRGRVTTGPSAAD